MKMNSFHSYKKWLFFLFLYALPLLIQAKESDFFKEKFNGISLVYSSPHEGVLSSLIRGFNKLAISYNINPPVEQVKEVVFCLQDAELLRKCIKLKKKDRIKKLIVGPNMFGRIIEENYLLLDKHIDAFLQPSEWTKIACIQDAPEIRKTIHVWPAGVDCEYWKPLKSKSLYSRKVLIYWKTEPESFCNEVKQVLERYSWVPCIIKYGKYNLKEYKERLSDVAFAVFLSKSESQGIALAECWAMDVPTLNWDPHELFYMGKHYDPVTSCPYLTNKTGKSWGSISELETLLENIPSYFVEFSPREWILSSMSDEVSVELLLNIINNC